MAEILIIEDEEKISRVLQLELEYEGYQVTLAKDGRVGLELAQTSVWDIILLDIMIPELNGLEVLRKFRKTNDYTPVILLTARDAIPDRVSGLDLGANDYVTKPFAIEELLARIRNLFRLTSVSRPMPDIVNVGALHIDLKKRLVKRNNEIIELTPKEFELLYYLASHKDEIKTREQIIEDVWGYDYVGETNIVDVYIRYLRQKIDADQTFKFIHTARGVGYFIKNEEEAL